MRIGRIGRRSGALAVVLASVLCTTANASTATFARIALDRHEGSAGSTVTGSGEGFDHWSSQGLPEGAAGRRVLAGPVRIHWNSLEGAVVWEGYPGLDGRISFRFTVPDNAGPGAYWVVATQTGYDGTPTGGTPARAMFRVTAPAGQTAQPTSGPPGGRRGRPRESAVVKDRATGGERSATAPSQVRPRPVADATEGPAASPAQAERGAPRDARGTVARPTAPPRNPAPRVAAAQQQERPWWHIAAIAALAVALIGGAAGGFVLVRRRAPKLGPDTADPDSVSTQPPDSVEAELQELLAEEAAREKVPSAIEERASGGVPELKP